MLCSFTSNQALYICKLYRFSRIIICVLTKLVLNSGQLIRETYIFAILKDKGIRELRKTGKSLFRYCRGSLSILSVCLEKLGLKGVAL
jgi:hypothetical protein